MDADSDTPASLPHDVNFEVTTSGYEIWFPDRINDDHADLVDECADWLEEQVGAINLGQIDHRTLLADGILTDDLKAAVVDWWRDRLPDR